MSREPETMGPLGRLMESTYFDCTDDTSLIPAELDDFANALFKMGFIAALQLVGHDRRLRRRRMDPAVREAMEILAATNPEFQQ